MSDLIRNNEYLIAMRPMLYLMKLICAVPVRLKIQHEIPFFITSRMVSFVTILTYMLFHYKYGGRVWGFITNPLMKNITYFIGKLPGIFFELLWLSVPLLMLNRNKEIQGYWDAWKLFQLKYESISSTPFISRKRRYIKKLSHLFILLMLLRNVYVMSFYFHSFHGDILYFIATFYLSYSVYLTLLYWVANCAYIWSASEDVMLLGKKIIAEKRADKLNQLISLWLDLSDLTDNFIGAHSFLFPCFFLEAIVSLIGYTFAIFHSFLFKKVFPLSGWIGLSVLYIVIFVVMCETAHTVQRQINNGQEEALLEENMMNVEAMTVKSVLRFLHAILLRNATVNMNGFFSLNRMTFPVVIDLSINCLIVLRQFSDGATEK